MIVCIRKRASEMLTLRFLFCFIKKYMKTSGVLYFFFFFLMAFHNIIIYMKILLCVYNDQWRRHASIRGRARGQVKPSGYCADHYLFVVYLLFLLLYCVSRRPQCFLPLVSILFFDVISGCYVCVVLMCGLDDVCNASQSNKVFPFS